MSDKPEQPQEEAGRGEIRDASVDMLNEIMDRSMPQIPDPPEWDEESAEESSQPEQTSPTDVSRETPEENKDSPSPSEKSRSPSSAYVYLAVLFGAAFLMLLLAYFVQQRNSDAVWDDLRTTTASREELLESIQQLEEENKKLQQDNDLNEYAVTQAREQYESARQERQAIGDKLDASQKELINATALGYLERFITEGDYLMAAAVAEDCDQNFNERNNGFPTKYPPLPIQAARYMELRDWLEKHGHIVIKQMALDSGTTSEWPVSALAAATWEESNPYPPAYIAARNLWGILRAYGTLNPDGAAMLLADFYKPELGNNLDYLNTKNFRPSTIELFEQIKADLMERGMLADVDGEIKYAQDGVPIEIPVVLPESDETGSGSSDVNPSHISDVWKNSTTVIYY